MNQRGFKNGGEVEGMKNELAFLRNQINYYKESWDIVSKFVDDVLEEDKKHQQIKIFFLENIAELQEETLQLPMVHRGIKME
jgi:hypothetical protein